MVDISGIGQNLGLDASLAAGAAAAAGVANKQKAVRKRPLASDKGLGLEDIPDDIPAVPVETAEAEKVPESTQAAESAPALEEVAATDFDEEENNATLAKIDYELASVQVLLKKVLFKKIALADKKHDDKDLQHRLLVGVAEHCKDAYAKLKEVRTLLG
ncbi:hypothetical protein NO2_0369 [Candidatus Termititenax persephonae]|uniref:Uncharacterized protein n=1 Tax=Candidatus Termititenax persephonae TaxID=2218525 RepID=A0A388TF98_9BACT|nr:hypothetical protein NO2_0369 [Candidatus Termititenax persephonae]